MQKQKKQLTDLQYSYLKQKKKKNICSNDFSNFDSNRKMY